MDKQLVQLLCILVVVASSNAEKWNTKDPLTKFYCEADELKLLAQYTLLNDDVRLLLLFYTYSLGKCFLQETVLSNYSESNSNCSLDVTTMEILMKHFNKTCQSFTTVNAYKYQMQNYLFNDANNATMPESVLQNLTSIVTGLQATARYLQQIAITEVIIPSMHYHEHIAI